MIHDINFSTTSCWTGIGSFSEKMFWPSISVAFWITGYSITATKEKHSYTLSQLIYVMNIMNPVH
jgi:hypothetical protein